MNEVFLVHEDAEGIYGVADSVEAAQVVAAEHVQDYFGRPIEWTVRGAGTDVEVCEGRYNKSAYQPGYVRIERYAVQTAKGRA